MNKKVTYEIFIGLLALMLSIMLVLELIIDLPNVVLKSFYYVNLIVWIIFVIDYLGRFQLLKKNKILSFENIIDLISIIPMKTYLIIFMFFSISTLINYNIIIKVLEVMKLIILIIKFKNKTKEAIRINKFNYLLILTTLVIVISAVLISLIEEMSFGDALWWCFVTFTTVGYGDVLLKTSLGRIVAVILMIVGIGFIGITTSAGAVYIINGGRRKNKNNFEGELIETVKYKLDNFNDLSEKDIEDIYKTLKSLKK